MGCYGCREATDLESGETVLGFPGNQIDDVVSSLKMLNEKAIPRSRGKQVYHRYMKGTETICEKDE